jgi:hypothetical protein
VFWDRERLAALARIEYLSGIPGKKKPSASAFAEGVN